MMRCMLWSKNNLKVYHRNQVNYPSDIRLATSLINSECHPCRTFSGRSHHKEDKSIAPTNYSDYVGFGYIIKKLVSSNFMGMLIPV